MRFKEDEKEMVERGMEEKRKDEKCGGEEKVINFLIPESVVTVAG